MPEGTCLNSTTACTTSQAVSQKIRIKPRVSGSPPDNDGQEPRWRHSCVRQVTERGRSYVELVQLLSLRSSPIRRVVRTGGDLPAMLALRPALAWLVGRYENPQQARHASSDSTRRGNCGHQSDRRFPAARTALQRGRSQLKVCRVPRRRHLQVDTMSAARGQYRSHARPANHQGRSQTAAR